MESERGPGDREQAEEEQEGHDEVLPAPWESDDYLAGGEPGRQRHDAFDLPKRRVFLKTLAKTGCILEACRAAKVSKSTVYDHQERDAEFDKHCRLALEMGSMPVELAAWERGVTGIEEEVIRGGRVIGYRMKRSDAVLRLLLQGANPKKYGPNPGFSRKRLMTWERKRIDQEVRAKIAAERPSFEASIEMLEKSLEALGARDDKEKLASGWIRMRDGCLIPPGWAWTGDKGDEDHDKYGPADE
ncbi:MAG: hypothetical protein QOJ53_2187 [Sphingomonadales bacterium]|jgi:hypothetical protein|nr:hypothetical protein [Sphingomonadales bacterium]MEA3047855.1 hypothetical protein [Sphingomonadales bacterium]